MPSEGLDSEYENGVADVLAFLAGDTATVQRNVKLPGHRSGRSRQVDVLVTREDVLLGEQQLVVDCKRWNKPLDLPDVEGFHAFLEDLGADAGILMTTKGASAGGVQFAKQARSIRVSILSVEELAQWSPRGTVHWDYEVPLAKQVQLSRAIRRKGFRVREANIEPRVRLHRSVGFSPFWHG